MLFIIFFLLIFCVVDGKNKVEMEMEMSSNVPVEGKEYKVDIFFLIG